MSIYINNSMEMPTTCGKCKIKDAIECNGWKFVRSISLDRHKDCPLIPVQPHGRLIDADELKKVIANAKHMDAGIFDGKTMYSDHLCVGADYDDVCAAIDETPTVIPAEEAK